MPSTTKTFVEQITKLATDFPTTCAAAALFYWDDNHTPGLRIEATAIMKEFINGVDFGRDPEGILFYNASSDFNFNDNQDVKYKVYDNTETPRTVRIDFLSPDKEAIVFASFLTKDTNSVNTNALQDGSGKWRSMRIGTSFATMHKIGNGTYVTLTLVPIGKEATFSVSDNSGKHAIDTDGVFYFNNHSDLTGFSIANYDSDRLLFYPNSDKKTLTGVFFPNVPIPIDDHGDANPPSATWSNL